jgi:hypothetical protein
MTDDPLASQKRQISSGCQTVGGCLAVIVLFIVIAEGTPLLVRHLTAIPTAANVIVLARPRHIANQVIWTPIIFVAVLMTIVASVKTANRRFIAVALLLVAFGAIAYHLWYRTWTAIEVRDSQVRLHYLWPRPVITIDPRDILSIGEIRSQEPSASGSDFLFRLAIETASGKYVSMANGAQSNITTAKARLRALNPKIAIRDAPLW